MKKMLMAAFIGTTLLAAASCTRTIEPDRYVSAMVALGCKNQSEGSEGGAAILKEQGVTLEEIQKFRKKADPKRMIQTAMEISRRVMECHGVKMESLPPQLPRPDATSPAGPAAE